ncbi:MAG: benzoyl-CoA reductase subunit D [Acidobacteria bacterium]|nr:MAG: benzoyl-CoA reductase subunit D [Acidobacteriota bacterium]
MNDDRRHLTAGIDAGSSAIKLVVARSRAGEEVEILARRVERIRRRDVRQVARAVFDRICADAGVAAAALDYVTSTGDVGAVSFHTGHFYSMTTHARGAVLLEPAARAVLDVGALHARAMRIDRRGKVLGQRMTSQCASGSGQFLENIARYLGVPLEEVGERSLASTSPEKCSGVCAVLAETDVINMVSRGIATADILKGIHLSIASRLVRLLRAVLPAGGVCLVTGGLSQDAGLLAAMREIAAADLEKGKPPLELRSHADAVLAGALGAAALGAYRFAQLARAGRLPATAA